MLAIGEIKKLDASAMDDLREQMSRRSRGLADLEGALEQASVIPSWIGEGANGASASYLRLAGEVADRAAQSSAILEMAATASDSIRAMQSAILDIVEEGEANQLKLVDPGEVVEDPGAAAQDVMLSTISPLAASAMRARREAVRTELQARVDQVRRKAADLEADIIEVLSSVINGEINSGGLNVEGARERGSAAADRMMQVPEPPADSNMVPAWKNALSAEELADLREERPEIDSRLERLDNQVSAFEKQYGRRPNTSTDWIMADALDPNSYLDKNNGANANIAIGRIETKPGQGVVRMNMYIPTDRVLNIQSNPGKFVTESPLSHNLGDNRGASPDATAEESRVSFYVDYERGLVVARQNPTAMADGSVTAAADVPEVYASQADDGSVRLEYRATDTFQPGFTKGIGVEGDVTVQPQSDADAKIGGQTTNYPSMEVYQYRDSDPDGRSEIYNYGATSREIGPMFNLLRDAYKPLPDSVTQVGHETVLGPLEYEHKGVQLSLDEERDVPVVPSK